MTNAEGRLLSWGCEATKRKGGRSRPALMVSYVLKSAMASLISSLSTVGSVVQELNMGEALSI